MDDTHASPTALARAVATRWTDDPHGAVTALDAGIAALERRAPLPPGERTRLRARSGQLRIFLGDLAGATSVLYRALEIEEDGYVALQLASALAWRGDAPARDEAAGHAGRAATVARRDRDGPLMIGASCVLGELALADGRPDDALRAYGEALGVAEFARSDAVSVAPLAGLAEAHLAGGAAGKAPELARRALGRAEAAGDEAGRARALLALAAATADPEAALRAAEAADAAPHRPLALRARRRALELGADGDAAGWVRAAEAMGLAGEARALRRLAAEAVRRDPYGPT